MLLIDIFGCDPEKLNIYDWIEAPEGTYYDIDAQLAWFAIFEGYGDADALVRQLLAELGGTSAEYQVIERSTKIREPRGVVPWFTVKPPVPEPEPVAPPEETP